MHSNNESKPLIEFYTSVNANFYVLLWIMLFVGTALSIYSIYSEISQQTLNFLQVNVLLNFAITCLAGLYLRYLGTKSKQPLFAIDSTGIHLHDLNTILNWQHDIHDIYLDVIRLPRGQIWQIKIQLCPDYKMTHLKLFQTSYSYQSTSHILRLTLGQKLQGNYTPESLMELIRKYSGKEAQKALTP